MTKNPFLQFIGHHKGRDETFLEFRGILKSAESFPEPKSWQELRSALKQIGASDSAIVGARMAWRSFGKKKRPPTEAASSSSM